MIEGTAITLLMCGQALVLWLQHRANEDTRALNAESRAVAYRSEQATEAMHQLVEHFGAYLKALEARK